MKIAPLQIKEEPILSEFHVELILLSLNIYCLLELPCNEIQRFL